MDDSFKNQFIKDLSYFNYNKKIKTSKNVILEKTLKSELNTETFKFILVLVNRDRINLLD